MYETKKESFYQCFIEFNTTILEKDTNSAIKHGNRSNYIKMNHERCMTPNFIQNRNPMIEKLEREAAQQFSPSRDETDGTNYELSLHTRQ